MCTWCVVFLRVGTILSLFFTILMLSLNSVYDSNFFFVVFKHYVNIYVFWIPFLSIENYCIIHVVFYVHVSRTFWKPVWKMYIDISDAAEIFLNGSRPIHAIKMNFTFKLIVGNDETKETARSIIQKKIGPGRRSDVRGLQATTPSGRSSSFASGSVVCVPASNLT